MLSLSLSLKHTRVVTGSCREARERLEASDWRQHAVRLTPSCGYRLLKSFLRELPRPLLPQHLSQRAVTIVEAHFQVGSPPPPPSSRITCGLRAALQVGATS
jgi:hypothetical protein